MRACTISNSSSSPKNLSGCCSSSWSAASSLFSSRSIVFARGCSDSSWTSAELAGLSLGGCSSASATSALVASASVLVAVFSFICFILARRVVSTESTPLTVRWMSPTTSACVATLAAEGPSSSFVLTCSSDPGTSEPIACSVSWPWKSSSDPKYDSELAAACLGGGDEGSRPCPGTRCSGLSESLPLPLSESFSDALASCAAECLEGTTKTLETGAKDTRLSHLLLRLPCCSSRSASDSLSASSSLRLLFPTDDMSETLRSAMSQLMVES
mmetsp:Transcript_14301/g.22196  ORF Transcript_14301/g.22196 Transcript_14301/m.22196 type:complete len:271 (-) Transcript_14301:108-920(-)